MTMLLGLGMTGTALFVLTFLIDGATRPGYDPIRQPVSALALGSRGWVQTTNFVVSGLLITGSAVGVARASESVWLGALVAVFGLGLVASGVYPMDPMRGYPPGTKDKTPKEYSVTHQRHDWAGLVVFTSLPAAALVATLTLVNTPWRVLSGLTAVALVLLFVIFATAWEADSRRAGLMQRLTITIGWAWLFVLCWHLMP